MYIMTEPVSHFLLMHRLRAPAAEGPRRWSSFSFRQNQNPTYSSQLPVKTGNLAKRSPSQKPRPKQKHKPNEIKTKAQPGTLKPADFLSQNQKQERMSLSMTRILLKTIKSQIATNNKKQTRSSGNEDPKSKL
jgi:hypothetical protein